MIGVVLLVLYLRHLRLRRRKASKVHGSGDESNQQHFTTHQSSKDDDLHSVYPTKGQGPCSPTTSLDQGMPRSGTAGGWNDASQPTRQWHGNVDGASNPAPTVPPFNSTSNSSHQTNQAPPSSSGGHYSAQNASWVSVPAAAPHNDGEHFPPQQPAHFSGGDAAHSRNPPNGGRYVSGDTTRAAEWLPTNSHGAPTEDTVNEQQGQNLQYRIRELLALVCCFLVLCHFRLWGGGRPFLTVKLKAIPL